MNSVEFVNQGLYTDINEVRKLNALEIDRVFDELEDMNAHTECVSLLAYAFGTIEEIKEIEEISRKHKKLNYIIESLQEQRRILLNTLLKKLIKAIDNYKLMQNQI